ncbi:MAG: sugar phosphate isomerase/epimerase family protein [Chloroflexota bacterium]
MAWRLALHTGSLGAKPLDLALRVARETGWDAVELRYVDFTRGLEAGSSADELLGLVKASGLPVSAVGVERGWVCSDGEEHARLVGIIDGVSRWAEELGAPIIMSPMDPQPGDLDRAAASLREVGDLVAQRGQTVALELNVGLVQFKKLQQVRDLLARAAHPNVGLLVDTYHIQRGGDGLETYESLAPGEIAYFQYSDVPDGPMNPPGNTFERLPPGAGVVPFAQILPIVAAKGYTGYLSYEALNPAAFDRDPFEVAAEALAASRKLG